MLRRLTSSRPTAIIALIAVTAIWGSTFLVVKNAVARAPVMDFLAMRFVIGAAVMLALRRNCLRGLGRRGVLRGILLGLALGGGYITQTYGLLTASPSVSGFITGTLVVFTPLLSWLVLRKRISRNAWLGVAIALGGVALLGLRGWSVGVGELLTLACAVFFALQVVGLGEWSTRETAYGLAFLQVATVAVVALAVAAPDGFQLPAEASVWGAIALTAVLATAVAEVVQTWAQSLMTPTHTAVVLTMEPVFAGLFGVVFGGDSPTLRLATGGICILTAMLLVQVGRTAKGVESRSEPKRGLSPE